jgi:hypothetical protein
MNGMQIFKINGEKIPISGTVNISHKNKFTFDVDNTNSDIRDYIFVLFNDNYKVELELITVDVEKRSYKGFIYKAEKKASLVKFYIKVKKGSYQHTSLIPEPTKPISYSEEEVHTIFTAVSALALSGMDYNKIVKELKRVKLLK